MMYEIHQMALDLFKIIYVSQLGELRYSSSSSSFILIQAARPIETADKDNDIEAHTNIKTQRDRQRGTVQ